VEYNKALEIGTDKSKCGCLSLITYGLSCACDYFEDQERHRFPFGFLAAAVDHIEGNRFLISQYTTQQPFG